MSPTASDTGREVSPLPKKTGLTATIIICTRNRPALLAKCLDAVAALKPQPDDVLVVDNSEGCPETEQLARKFSARYTIEPTPGLSRARLRGGRFDNQPGQQTQKPVNHECRDDNAGKMQYVGNRECRDFR